LSQDLAKFCHLANINWDFADLLDSRFNIELPRLRQFASEIQKLNDKGIQVNSGQPYFS